MVCSIIPTLTMSTFIMSILQCDYLHRIIYNISNKEIDKIPFAIKLHHTPRNCMYKFYNRYFETTKKYWLMIPRELWTGDPESKTYERLVHKINTVLPMDLVKYIYKFIPFKHRRNSLTFINEILKFMLISDGMTVLRYST
jgi:hypothetical protein